MSTNIKPIPLFWESDILKKEKLIFLLLLFNKPNYKPMYKIILYYSKILKFFTLDFVIIILSLLLLNKIHYFAKVSDSCIK